MYLLAIFVYFLDGIVGKDFCEDRVQSKSPWKTQTHITNSPAEVRTSVGWNLSNSPLARAGRVDGRHDRASPQPADRTLGGECAPPRDEGCPQKPSVPSSKTASNARIRSELSRKSWKNRQTALISIPFPRRKIASHPFFIDTTDSAVLLLWLDI